MIEINMAFNDHIVIREHPLSHTHREEHTETHILTHHPPPAVSTLTFVIRRYRDGTCMGVCTRWDE